MKAPLFLALLVFAAAVHTPAADRSGLKPLPKLGSYPAYTLPRTDTSFSSSPRTVYVSPTTRYDGTYVSPHFRTAPDRSFNNNWSTYPNVNPYTGKVGTRAPNPFGP